MTYILCLSATDKAIKAAWEQLRTRTVDTGAMYDEIMTPARNRGAITPGDVVFIVGHASATGGMGADGRHTADPDCFAQWYRLTELGINKAGKVCLVACSAGGLSIEPGQGFAAMNFAANLSKHYFTGGTPVIAAVGPVDANTLQVYMDRYYATVYASGWIEYKNGKEVGMVYPPFLRT